MAKSSTWTQQNVNSALSGAKKARTIVSHTSPVMSHGDAAAEAKAKRLADAQAAGLTGDFADQYVNAARKNTYKDTFWDKFRKFFGGKQL